MENEFFVEDNNVISIKLDKGTDGYKVYFIILDEYIDNEEIIQFFNLLNIDLMRYVFDKKVNVYFTDEYFVVKRSLLKN